MFAAAGDRATCSLGTLPLLSADTRPRLVGAPALPRDVMTPATSARVPAHSRDERRLARIDRKVAERDRPAV
jgi:hypothetical protein